MQFWNEENEEKRGNFGTRRFWNEETFSSEACFAKSLGVLLRDPEPAHFFGVFGAVAEAVLGRVGGGWRPGLSALFFAVGGGAVDLDVDAHGAGWVVFAAESVEGDSLSEGAASLDFGCFGFPRGLGT